MKHFESAWVNREGLKFYLQGWEPDGRPKAVVALVHGLGEHTGRYDHVGAAFTQAGFVLAGFDLRGHGRSQGARGHVPSFEAYLQDIDDFLAELAQKYPGLPCFLYGHSLGATLVLNYVLRRKIALAGVIATGAGLHTALQEQAFKILIARLLGFLLPALPVNSGMEPHLLSRDPQVVQAYIHDPLVHDRVTLGFGRVMLPVIPWVFQHASEFRLPLLLMHGEKDRVTYPSGSREFAGLVPGPVALKIWEGCFHEIHNEPGKAEVLAAMVAWMDAQLKGK